MPRILIVDDSPTIRKMVRASLRTLEAFDFIEAGNGLEAIEQVALGPVALMILDLNMSPVARRPLPPARRST